MLIYLRFAEDEYINDDDYFRTFINPELIPMDDKKFIFSWLICHEKSRDLI